MPNAPQNLLTLFLSDIEQTTIIWQIVVVALSSMLAWAMIRLLSGYFPKPEIASKFSLAGVYKVTFPILLLLIVLIGREILKRWHTVHLLNILVPLLIALVLISLLIYTLRQVFAPSRWLHGSERFIILTVWLGFALHLTGILPEILGALDYLSFHIGDQRISILNILGGILAILVTMLTAMWLGRMLERTVMATNSLDLSLRVVLSKLLRAVLIVLGVLIALPLAGINITVLSVFGGALGVGIGFGLQKIASNYLSGFIILLDRSIHPGDVLTVDGRFGKVSKLTSRYLLLQSTDGTEAIIPNDTLVNTTVVNHSYSNRQIRIGIPVQISYQSDLLVAMEIMRQAAVNQSRVLADPVTKVFLKSFGDNGIDLELSIWINDPEEGQRGLCSDINMEIWRKFKENNIEIPYPQRDLRIIGGQQTLDNLYP